MSLDENTQIYITECHELLDDMEAALLALENSPDDADLINRVFRAAHTIKGSAGLFGFDNIISFTHVAENLLDDVRNGLVPVTDDLISLLIRAKDHIAMQVEALVDGEAPEPEEEQALMELLSAYKAGGSSSSVTQSAQLPETSQTEPLASDNYHISVRLGIDTFRLGFNPAVMFEQLSELGEIEHAHLVSHSIPSLDELDPEDCHLGWEIVLKTAVKKQTIANVLDFYEGASVHILPPGSRVNDYQELIKKLPEDEAALGQILVEVGALTASELQQALNLQKADGGLTGEILVAQGAVQPEVVDTALQRQDKIRTEMKRQSSFVRVDAEKLDKLVTLVGELVISGAKVSQVAIDRDDEELSETIEEMTSALEEMRETALGLRMVPLANTFNRFQRVVRDTAKELKKQIRLDINGGEAELDKTVIERIGDPLTHLIRNSMDHGLESPTERLNAGKPEQGVITLNAYHETGTIVIEVSDDGRGLDADRILALAQQRGLVQSHQSMSETEIFNLIFEPGFSTADSVNNLSGRGVGMDVVRRNIESLRGNVVVESKSGEGTCVTIRLPLTLAIIDGFNVSVGDEFFIIPLDMMEECVSLTESQRAEAQVHDYINLRDEVLPIIRMHNYLAIEHDEQTEKRHINVVVVRYSGKKLGLLVDELHGEVQVVIKPLGKVFQGIPGFAGFTIMGSGRVAMIMDIPDLVKSVAKLELQHHQSLGRNIVTRHEAETISIH